MNQPNRRNAVILVGGAVAVGIGLWIYVLRSDHITTHSLPEDEDPSAVAARELAAAGASLAPGPSDAGDKLPTLDKAKRDAMRKSIYEAWGMAPPDEKTHPSTWPERAGSTGGGEGFGKEYIQKRIREDYLPLAKDCYEQGLKKTPTLGGKLVANFRIVGSKGTGGLIDWVDFDSEENTLDDRDVNECLKQSLYSVTFDPPPNDGTVTVTYPITFLPDKPDSEAPH